MLPIREIRAIAARLDSTRFGRELGPFVLIQQPPAPGPASGTQVMGVPRSARGTQAARPDKLNADTLALLFRFDDLLVANLPPMEGSETLSVGRAPDCDLVLEDPSVSKRHAQLRWSAAGGECAVLDLGSTNGTFLNGDTRLHRAVTLRDGDIVAFGDVPFWYLLTPTLHERLRTGSGARRLGSRSG